MTANRSGYVRNKDGTVKLASPSAQAKFPLAEEDSFTFHLFQELLENERDKGMDDEEIPELARFFYNKAARRGKLSSPQDILAARKRMRKNVQIGKMYFFQYHAKHEKTLPYWDKFPLIFPIGPAKGGFLGINFHYLPPTLRIGLMERLYDLAASNSYTDQTKLKISYGILKAAAGLEPFKPCVKHYLLNHVRSPFIQVYYSEWAMACAMPVQQFQKRSERTVWNDSKRKI